MVPAVICTLVLLQLIIWFDNLLMITNRHRLPETWWTDQANYSEWAEEMIGMREMLIKYAGGGNKILNRENILGMRAPYVKPGMHACIHIIFYLSLWSLTFSFNLHINEISSSLFFSDVMRQLFIASHFLLSSKWDEFLDDDDMSDSTLFLVM